MTDIKVEHKIDQDGRHYILATDPEIEYEAELPPNYATLPPEKKRYWRSKMLREIAKAMECC